MCLIYSTQSSLLLLFLLFFFLMIRRPPRSTLDRSSAASDVYKRQDTVVWIGVTFSLGNEMLRAVIGKEGSRELRFQFPPPGDIAVDGHRYGSRCLLYTSPSPRDRTRSRMPSSA